MRSVFFLSMLIIQFLGFVIQAQSRGEQDIDFLIGNYQFQKALGIIDNRPESKDLMLKKAVCLKSLHKYTEAVTVYKELSSRYPEEKQPVIELALCYQALSEWDKSTDCYSRLIETDSTNVYFKIQLAEMYVRQEKYTKALEQYKALVEVYDMQNMLRQVAVCYDRLNRTDSAATYYTKAWERDFFDTSSVTGLINLNIKKGKPGLKEAIRISDTYVNNDSTNRQINLLNALSYYAADSYKDAVLRFDRCYTKGDSSLVVLRSLGLSYYYLGQKDDAYTFLQKAYDADSTNINVMYALGVIANEKMDYDTGVKCFETLIDKVVPADFTLHQYYRNQGIAYEGKKKYLSAVDSFKKALEYANEKQKMLLYYNIVSIYEVDLKLPNESLEYYELYRGALFSYYQDLLKAENIEEADQLEINVTKAKLNALDKHISRLKKSLGLVTSQSTVKISSTLKINL